MTPKEVKTAIKSVGIPTAYHAFAEKTKQQPPFLCYFFDGSEDLLADNINYAKIEKLYVELYTDEKDFALEKEVEAMLNKNSMVFSKDEDYIDSEHMHVTVYTTSVNLEV